MKLFPLTALLCVLCSLVLPATAGALEEEATEISIQRLTSINYRKGRPLPADIQALDGKRVSLEGYMNLGTEEGLESFYLVSDACGCGGSPKMNHFIDVTMPEGETTAFTPEPITVIGVLEVGEVYEDGFITSIYRLKAETIE